MPDDERSRSERRAITAWSEGGEGAPPAKSVRRSWILVGAAAAAVGLTAVLLVLLVPRHQSPSNGTQTATTGATKELQGAIGDTLKVGVLDLRVESVDPAFDSTRYGPSNTATVEVHLTATNVRGADDSPLEFGPSAFLLMDNQGAAYPATAACAGCPGRIAPVQLVPRGGLAGSLYFTVPAGRTPTTLTYTDPGTSLKARISLKAS